MEDILWAAVAGYEARVVRLLDEDPALLEGGDGFWGRPLVRAAEGGHLRVVTRYLLLG
jgi:hypothetical protein